MKPRPELVARVERLARLFVDFDVPLDAESRAFDRASEAATTHGVEAECCAASPCSFASVTFTGPTTRAVLAAANAFASFVLRFKEGRIYPTLPGEREPLDVDP